VNPAAFFYKEGFMDLFEVTWEELFEDEDVDADFEPALRHEPPWFGFVPRVLALDFWRPYKPAFALWRRGTVIEVGHFGVDRRKVGGRVKPLLALAEQVADYCRERRLFGGHLATFDLFDCPARAAATAAVMREADWCGMFVLEPIPYFKKVGGEPAALLAEAAAAELAAGGLTPPEAVARRRRTASARGSDLSLKGALVSAA
jgi:hypothetical protein